MIPEIRKRKNTKRIAVLEGAGLELYLSKNAFAVQEKMVEGNLRERRGLLHGLGDNIKHVIEYL